MDSHFDGYNHIIGIEAEFGNGERTWLPIIDKNGHPDRYIYSFNWVKWTFRVNGPNINQEDLKRGIRDFATFWTIKNGLDVDDAKFNIYFKRCVVPKKWEYNFLRIQENAPWEKIGVAYWEDKAFHVSLPIVEDL